MNQLKPLYIIGAGGFGRETAWLVERINAVSRIWDLRGFMLAAAAGKRCSLP